MLVFPSSLYPMSSLEKGEGSLKPAYLIRFRCQCFPVARDVLPLGNVSGNMIRWLHCEREVIGII